MMTLRGAILGLGLLTLAGCGNPNVDRLGGGGEGIVWPEHEALFSPEVFGGIDYSLQMPNGIPGAMDLASSDSFKSAVTAFKGSALPGSISDRTAQRDQVNAALDAMIAAAEEKKADDFKTAFDEAKQANQALMKVDTPAAE